MSMHIHMYEHEHTHHGTVSIMHWGRVLGKENESEKGIERETLEPYTLRPAPWTPTVLQHSATLLSAICRVSKSFMTTQDVTCHAPCTHSDPP